MPRILIAGYQHETNTFAPSLADWDRLHPRRFVPGLHAQGRDAGPLSRHQHPGGRLHRRRQAHGWTLLPSCWAGAIPSST
jgi:microcystin degradation protein MlrC